MSAGLRIDGVLKGDFNQKNVMNQSVVTNSWFIPKSHFKKGTNSFKHLKICQLTSATQQGLLVQQTLKSLKKKRTNRIGEISPCGGSDIISINYMVASFLPKAPKNTIKHVESFGENSSLNNTNCLINETSCSKQHGEISSKSLLVWVIY